MFVTVVDKNNLTLFMHIEFDVIPFFQLSKATIGITIDENEHLSLPRARGALRMHHRMDTRLLTIRLVPGFDDGVIRQLIETVTGDEATHQLKGLVLQLYGTGNAPSVKKSFVQMIGDAVDRGILVVANTQCHTGSVLLGTYII